MTDHKEGPESFRETGVVGDDRLDPYEIDFLPEFREGRGPKRPFVNEHGVLIGDHDYVSADSPLEQWSTETDPAIMSGDQWVHPFKDIGFHTAENRDYFERGIPPKEGIFLHAVRNTASAAKRPPEAEEPEEGNRR
ncbi:hypothetical protein J31TS4_43370 [Paenibacillus sp. J31TS4]|uniref:DUF3905 domain-containing protein n=1 Tax=Paenibacillus sp. J31TS4 TaxID=2807195 RepID=UPI001B1710D3|nr:DUF3905 domain-containing protein [Paenibacillus sp. J31TS4]GIP41057.1 hypothetical protein J31TS4_43370 [Paenibacillus sp. J31TS4]